MVRDEHRPISQSFSVIDRAVGSQSDQAASRKTKSGAQPKFNTEPADESDPEVKKHNEEMDRRNEQSRNKPRN